jgi:hypothetical protein
VSGLFFGVNMKYKSGDVVEYNGLIYLLMDYPNNFVSIGTKGVGVKYKYQKIQECHDQYAQILKYGKKLYNAWEEANKTLLELGNIVLPKPKPNRKRVY